MSESEQSAGNSEPSFFERKREALANERGVINDEPPLIPETVELGQHDEDAHQAESQLIDDPDALDADEVTDDQLDDQEVDLDDDAEGADELSEDAAHWKAKAEEAEHLRNEMQGDYTRKTQVLAQQRRQIESDAAMNAGVLQTYVNNAETYLSRWNNVNWQNLQQTLDPAQYQQRVSEYRQAVALKDKALGQHQGYVNQASEMLERQKNDEAALSKDILKGTIPGWGNELYGQLAEHAKQELEFTSEEFSDFTDHRLIRLIYKDFASRDPKRAQNIRKKSSRTNSQTRNVQRRSSEGKFRTAKQDHRERPGDREASVNFFREKLQREREGAQNRR